MAKAKTKKSKQRTPKAKTKPKPKAKPSGGIDFATYVARATELAKSQERAPVFAPKATKSELAAIEKAFGFELPAGYRSMMLDHGPVGFSEDDEYTYGTFQFLSPKRVIAATQIIRDNYLPIVEDDEQRQILPRLVFFQQIDHANIENMYGFDTATGEVRPLYHDDWDAIKTPSAASFSAHLSYMLEKMAKWWK